VNYLLPRLLFLLVLLLAAPVAAQEQKVEFQPREGARAGWSWLEDASWNMKGRSVVKLGRITLRNRTFDRHTNYSCSTQVAAVEGELASDLGLHCDSAQSSESGKPDKLEIAGLDVRALGVGKKRVFKTARGRRLKKAQRQFFERRFRGREAEDKDPLQFLLPKESVLVGDTWSMDLRAIQEWFGPERFTMDMSKSHAQVVCSELVVRGGEPFARLEFSTLLVPAAIKDGEFTEASMELTGTALIPLRGDLPYRELELQTTIRFLGKVKAKGVRVNLDIDTRLDGFEKRTPDAS
jgi:hypothetical protein